MTDLRFGVFGAGFWAPFQLAGWREMGSATCVAIYNLTISKAEKYRVNPSHRVQSPPLLGKGRSGL